MRHAASTKTTRKGRTIGGWTICVAPCLRQAGDCAGGNSLWAARFQTAGPLKPARVQIWSLKKGLFRLKCHVLHAKYGYLHDVFRGGAIGGRLARVRLFASIGRACSNGSADPPSTWRLVALPVKRGLVERPTSRVGMQNPSTRRETRALCTDRKRYGTLPDELRLSCDPVGMRTITLDWVRHPPSPSAPAAEFLLSVRC